ncbi:MAG TPA: hypothetical protein VGM79_16095, partial [Streptosporangiaceae bacterium]
MSLEVVTGVAARWADHVGDDVPVHASAPWVAATAHRLTRDRLTFLAEAQPGLDRPRRAAGRRDEPF